MLRSQLAASSQQHQQRSASVTFDLHDAPTGQRINPAFSQLHHVRSVSASQAIARPGEQSPLRLHTSMTETVPEFDVDLADIRPKKRARIDESVELVSSPQSYNADLDEMHQVMPGTPLTLPRRPTDAIQRRTIRRPVGEEAMRKSDGVSPPAMATRLPAPKNFADFSPWHGNHPEDVLNEQVVKSGYAEKQPSPNQNESNSARLLISAKNPVLLHTLSLLFTQAMEKRQALGRCTAPSTFKPPPRVTVTDTKREAWLKDLANSSIPLRRQSRTIPHGIRGKLLLEQCIAKAIPLQRAVWLAKCVGANELRAFRRKGVAGPVAAQGEAKWIRDWTVAVEQFLSDIIQSNTQPGWRTKFDYAIKLVTILGAEDLLERDHFLDFIVASMSSTDLERAPSWLCMAKLHWQAICQFGRRGRQLARALLKCLHTVNDSGLAAYDTLKQHLLLHLRAMADHARHCLVLPEEWRKHEATLLDLDSKHDLSERNRRLLLPELVSASDLCHPVVQLYEILAKIDLSLDLRQLVRACRDLMPSTVDLVDALLSWTCTKYQHGAARETLTEQVLMVLHQDGCDTDTAILAYLERSLTLDMNPKAIYRVIAYLTRNICFSTGRFLKWLITSGTISSGITNLAAGYLVAMPSQGLPIHLNNTKSSLLSRLSGNELAAMNAETASLESKLDDVLSSTPAPAQVHSLFKQYSAAALGDIADWLRIKLNSFKTSMTSDKFCVFRDAFEACHELDEMCNLMDMALITDDFSLLASITDTINAHALELVITSRLSPLVDKLCARYRVLRTQQPLERHAINSLRSLFQRLPAHVIFQKLLNNDLLICDRQNMSAVCSPASDNLISIHAASIDSDEQIEAVFASGNTMEEQVMQRVFDRIMQRAQKPSTAPSPVCWWLSHLRTLEPNCFDGIAAAYVDSQLSQEHDTAPSGLYILLAADCYSFEKLITASTSTRSAGLILKLAAAPLPEDMSMDSAARYHLELQRNAFCHKNIDTVLTLATDAQPELNGTMDIAWLASVCDLVCSKETTKEVPSQLCRMVLTSIDQDTYSTDLSPSTIIANTNALNAHICAAWLKSQTAEDHIRPAIIDAIKNDSPVWAIMLQACSQAVIKAVHDWVLSCLVKHQKETYLLAIFLLTSSLLKNNVEPGFLGMMANQLKSLQKTLSATDEVEPEVTSQALDMVRTLLRIVVLGSAGIAVEGETTMQGRAYVILALCSLLSTQAISNDATLYEHTADVANMFIDKLPSELISRLEKSARNAGLSKKALATCFGKTWQPDAWLALASSSQPGMPSRLLTKAATGPTPSLLSGTPRLPSQHPVLVKPMMRAAQQNVEMKYTPYTLKKWEIMPDPSPAIGENDSSISLTLFGARRV